MSNKPRHARVLYLWEWGAGFGHLRRFLPLALRLLHLGYEVALVVKDPSRAEEVFRGLDVSIWQTPDCTSPPAQRCKDPHSFGGLAWNLSVNDGRRVSSTVAQWKHLLLSVKPTHVISDFGLLGSFVAAALQIPTSRIGTGFGMPPHSDVLASMFDVPVGLTEQNLAQRVLELVQSSAVENGLPAPLDWNHLFATTGPSLLVSVPDFDPYRRWRAGESYLGVWDSYAAGEPHWKDAAGAKVIAYLKPTAKLEQQCRKLADLGLNVLLVCDGQSTGSHALENAERIALSKNLVSLERGREDCSLIVCNANHGMTLKSLEMGIPVAMFPLFIEQRLNANAVERLGLGIDMSRHSESSWQQRIELLLNSAENSQRSGDYAEYLQQMNASSLTNAAAILQNWIEATCR